MMSGSSREVSLNSAMQTRFPIVLIISFRFSLLPSIEEVVDFFSWCFSFCSISSSSKMVNNDCKNWLYLEFFPRHRGGEKHKIDSYLLMKSNLSSNASILKPIFRNLVIVTFCRCSILML